MKIAHVRERHAPAGAPWRLAAALDPGEAPARWLDLEVARRRAVAARPAPRPRRVAPPPAGHDARRPSRARAARRGARATWSTGFEPRDDGRRRRAGRRRISRSGRRSCGRRRSATSTRSRATSGRCGSAAAARCPRPGTACRSSTSRNVSEIRGPDEPVWCAGGVARSSTTSWRSPRSSTRRRVDLPPERAEEAIGGYTIFNDWSARDLQRDETAVRLGPAKGKDFASVVRAVAGDAGRAGRRARRAPASTWR